MTISVLSHPCPSFSSFLRRAWSGCSSLPGRDTPLGRRFSPRRPGGTKCLPKFKTRARRSLEQSPFGLENHGQVPGIGSPGFSH